MILYRTENTLPFSIHCIAGHTFENVLRNSTTLYILNISIREPQDAEKKWYSYQFADIQQTQTKRVSWVFNVWHNSYLHDIEET